MERRKNSCEVLDYIDHIGAYGFEHVEIEVGMQCLVNGERYSAEAINQVPNIGRRV
jgi:hypothetical protein